MRTADLVGGPSSEARAVEHTPPAALQRGVRRLAEAQDPCGAGSHQEGEPDAPEEADHPWG
jgi:hypothetical protein